MGVRSLAGALAALALLAGPARAAVSEFPLGDFSEPIFLTAPPGDASRVFVVERAGRIQVVHDGIRKQFLDISSTVDASGERGLLSMAFAPDYATSGLLYLFDVESGTGDVQVEEFKRSALDPDAADPASRRAVLDRPHSASNHNGGQLQFGPDGYLYVSIGDNANGPNGQDRSNVYGKLLRIDPRAGHALAPGDNPFVAENGDAPLVWSLGLRNPWRFSFDRATGDLTIGDVGAGSFEEVNWVPAASGAGRGVNFGWPTCEGTCATAGMTNPVWGYDHSSGQSCYAIVGGYVVRAADLPSLAGRYVYGDECFTGIHSIALRQPTVTDVRAEIAGPSALYSFGEDSCGHVYLVSGSGPVTRLSESSPPPACPASAPAPSPAPGPAPPPPAPAAPAAPAPDTTPPRLAVRFRARQRVLRRRSAVVRASCDEGCTLTGAGSVGGGLFRGRSRLAIRGVESAPGAAHRIRLRLTRRALGRIRASLARARHSRRVHRLYIRARVRASDSSGNRTSRAIRIRIVG
jgi:hypothetical protein